MTQSNPNFELPEVPLPPEPPLEEDGPIEVTLVLRDPPEPQYPVSAVTWPACREFDTWQEAFNWAFYQRKAEGPRYFIHKMRTGEWEAIQEWMRNL